MITESGTLPAGVTFGGGALSGTPTVSGTFPVTLTATNGIEAAAKQSFTLTVTTAIPTVTSVAPAAGPASGGSSVVITGTNLGSATAVDFGATPGTITADSATSITATAPAGSAGPVDVTVTTPGGTSATSAERPVHLCGRPDRDGHRSDRRPDRRGNVGGDHRDRPGLGHRGRLR